MPETSRNVMDFGSGCNQWLIDVTDVSREREKKQTSLSKAFIGFHTVTGCEFTSTQYGKGNIHLLVIWKRTESMLSH